MKKFLKIITPRFIKRVIIENRRLDALAELHYEFGYNPMFEYFDDEENKLFDLMTSKIFRILKVYMKYNNGEVPKKLIIDKKN